MGVPVSVQGIGEPSRPDFIRDVAPVIAKMGCNQGTCHGAAQGKNGFKLSLRGYDAIADVRALTDDLASRRANIASPENSLMLLKATATVPHVGGQLTKVGDDYYELLRQWLAGGARLNKIDSGSNVDQSISRESNDPSDRCDPASACRRHLCGWPGA